MSKTIVGVAIALMVPAIAWSLGPQDLAEMMEAESVPEIDALAGFSAVALIGATLALLKARRG